jgi:hypothetical protein
MAVVTILMHSCAMGAPGATGTPPPTETLAPTDTPVPTNTPTPTADKTATKAEQIQATAAAETDIAIQSMAAVSDAMDGINEPVGSGRLLYWNADPIAVESSGPQVLKEHPLPSGVQAGDFAFHSKIIWEVKQKVGWVNCVVIYRMSADVSSFYWMNMGRVSGAGHVYIQLFFNGAYIADSGYPFISNSINVDNQGQNDVLLVVRGSKHTIYVNRTKVGVWFNAKIAEGGFDLATYQDTGASVCTFTNTWVWGFE